ncbi:MAG: phosphatase PAP2 family protein [Pelobium sp.]
MRDKLAFLLPSKIRKFYLQNINDSTLTPHFTTIFVAIIIMVIGIVLFLLVTNKMRDNEMQGFDDFIVSSIIKYRSERLTILMKTVTTIGDIFGYLFLVTMMALFFYLRKRWRTALQVALVLVLASGLNVFLKFIISRPRPIINRIANAGFYSFPSGHAMSAIVFYGFIAYLSIALIKKRGVKSLIIMLCASMVAIIGISRIYLGVHFPSDILAGYLAGISWLMFCIIILNVITLKKLHRLNLNGIAIENAENKDS